MAWIKFVKRQPPNGKEVLVRFGNGKEIKGKKEGNWMVYPPKEIDGITLMSREREWLE
jgi:hypothetical protein